MADDISVLKPWTIKAIDARVAEEIVAEARRTDTNAGALIERMWAAWKANGSPVHVPAPAAPSMDLAALLQAAGPFNVDNPMPGQVRSLLNDIARAHRGPRQGNGVARIGAAKGGVHADVQ